MSPHDFSQVDFRNSEIAASLRRAYAILLKITLPQEQRDDCQGKERPLPVQTAQPRKPEEQRYQQLRLF